MQDDAKLIETLRGLLAADEAAKAARPGVVPEYRDSYIKLRAAAVTALPALLDRLSTLSRDREDGWQPIETAPKDGTRFLAYEDGNHYALEWKQEMPGPDGGYWVCFCGQYVTMTPEPTHWQPLPAPPALKETPDGP